jgi:DNA-binding HxlR family transcriptional regulator
MPNYDQFCPVAKSLDILGDRWTLLIVRDLLTGTRHFNELERGLPGISRALLALRLRQLRQAGVIDKTLGAPGRQSTDYRLTPAGQALGPVVDALTQWGEAYALGDGEPSRAELDPGLLMGWLRKRANRASLPAPRVVARFDFSGAARASFWLILTPAEATLCLADPGLEIQLQIRGDLAVFYKLYAGRLRYPEALSHHGVRVDGAPALARAFPEWFGWSAPLPPPPAAVRAAALAPIEAVPYE